MADSVEEALEDAAKAGVQSVTVGDRSTTAMDPLKQIEVDKYLAAKANASRGLAANLRRTRCIPPSALGD